MTKPIVSSPRMQRLLATIADEAELTNDQLFELLKLIVAGRTDDAVKLLHSMMNHQKDVVRIMNRLKYLEVEAAEKLLLNKD